jgi:MFS transporter, MHS family, alpha-ketoglutarate permease
MSTQSVSPGSDHLDIADMERRIKAIFIGSIGFAAPAIALSFKNAGHEKRFYYYLSGMIFLSLLIYSTMRDTKHESAIHRHE